MPQQVRETVRRAGLLERAAGAQHEPSSGGPGSRWPRPHEITRGRLPVRHLFITALAQLHALLWRPWTDRILPHGNARRRANYRPCCFTAATAGSARWIPSADWCGVRFSLYTFTRRVGWRGALVATSFLEHGARRAQFTTARWWDELTIHNTRHSPTGRGQCRSSVATDRSAMATVCLPPPLAIGSSTADRPRRNTATGAAP